jgi:hypothetical protein
MMLLLNISNYLRCYPIKYAIIRLILNLSNPQYHYEIHISIIRSMSSIYASVVSIFKLLSPIFSHINHTGYLLIVDYM